MARYVKLAAVAPSPYVMNAEQPHNRSVEEMARHWDAAMAPVLADKPDFVLLPEACDRPPNFTLEQRYEYYAARGDRIRDHFCQVALSHHTNIGYSAARQLSDGSWRNSTQFIGRDGSIQGIYDKNHLVFPGECIDAHLDFGTEIPKIQLDFGTVGGLICYDLNFDELRERYKAVRPDVLAFSSMFDGSFMRQFWAYNVRSWLLSSVPSTVGRCALVSPAGAVVGSSPHSWPYIVCNVNLDCEVVHMTHNRPRIFEAKKKYGPLLTMSNPSHTDAITIQCESEDITIQDIMKEFDMEPINMFLDSSRTIRAKQIEKAKQTN